ncbi:uncharacterized protein LOC143191506 isoform X2 [Rhynchophorus ferrugineus]|uniref:uncharacterized protein LOC143191506 isoform X2 n=1 Tax=Rhynchophorus ferrugineus TaxID=354439 RepID=UPI003FCD6173
MFSKLFFLAFIVLASGVNIRNEKWINSNNDQSEESSERKIRASTDLLIHDVEQNSIPLDFAKTINEYNISDLLLNFVEDMPKFEAKVKTASRFGGADEDDNDTERSSQIARPAKCMPELKPVKIIESKDPNIFYIPECTRIERCGGCCSHVLLSCQPTETETVTFSVMKTEYTGNKKLKYVGKELVLVEKHTKCRCNCKVKAEDCNTYQEYIEQECRCSCKNIDEEKKCYKRSSKKLWNPDLCACQCREVTPCSTGYQFDYNDCKCVQSQVKRRYILNAQKET